MLRSPGLRHFWSTKMGFILGLLAGIAIGYFGRAQIGAVIERYFG